MNDNPVKSTPPKAVIYTRVSTESQDATLQEPLCRQFCEANGWQICKVYSDSASGRDGNRPGWRSLMKDASEHQFDIVIATKIDRIMRSVASLDTEINRLMKCGVELRCVSQPIDFHGSQGKLMLQLLGAIAEWERNIISERTKDALAVKKSQGVRLGRPPSAPPDIAALASLRRSGMSWNAIAKLVKMSPNTIRQYKEEIEKMAEESA